MAQQGPAPLIPTFVRHYVLDKLTGQNYRTWSKRVELLMKRATLWAMVSGALPKPAQGSPNLADWTTRDLQAQSELLLLLCTTYHHEDLITRVTALKKLLSFTLGENQNTSQFLDDCWHTLLDNDLLSGLQLDDSL